MEKSEKLKRGFSACMIVRDEEENLARCLTSIKDFVDEIIIVDTGSVDRTVEIAESFGASVFHLPWEGNYFSASRNYSLSKANYDWYFIIDADEELYYEDKIREWILNRPESDNSVAIQLHNIRDGKEDLAQNTSRFFRNGVMQYQHIIHNEPIFDKKSSVFCPYAYLKHYGYDLTPEKKQKKFDRTVGLLKIRLEQQPDDYLALFYLQQMHAGHQLFKEATVYGEEYVKHKEDLINGRFNKSVYFTMVRCFMYLDDKENCSKWLQIGLAELPEDLDMSLALMEYGLNMKEPDLMIMGAEKYISLYDWYEKDPMAIGDMFVHSRSPETLAFCAFHLCVYQLRSGFSNLNVLNKALGNTDPEFTQMMLDMLQQQLGPCGFQVKNTGIGAKISTGINQTIQGVH